jgi:hypothetical protein
VAADLDDWVDQPIDVEFLTIGNLGEGAASLEPSEATDFTLEGADESGILLGYADESDLSDYRMLFFAWHRIKRLYLLTP